MQAELIAKLCNQVMLNGEQRHHSAATLLLARHPSLTISAAAILAATIIECNADIVSTQETALAVLESIKNNDESVGNMLFQARELMLLRKVAGKLDPDDDKNTGLLKELTKKFVEKLNLAKIKFMLTTASK